MAFVQWQSSLWQAALVVVLCLCSHVASAQINDELIQQQEDARLYLEMIDILKDAPIADQIAGWEKFLGENPNSYFKDEVTSNLESMKLRRQAIEKAREEQDSRLYFRTIEQASSLSLSDQIKVWERFVRENPDSVFANEARTTLNRLREEQRWGGGEVPTAAAKKKPPVSAIPSYAKVTQLQPNADKAGRSATVDAADAPEPKRKDPEQALFLAAVPGIAIPGLGHFYSHRYAMGGFLVALRLSGLSFMGVGLYREINQLIIPGAALALLSYGLDVFMAPLEARAYNEALEPLPVLDESRYQQRSLQPLASPVQLAWSWRF